MFKTVWDHALMKKGNLSVLSLAGEILLTLYLYFISYFYTLSVPLSWTAPLRLAVLFLAVHMICRWMRRLKIRMYRRPRKMNKKFGLLMFLLTAGILGLYYIAYYPGGIIVDSFNQWYQVQKGAYVDWHPVIHTLLFMKLPSLLCNHLAFVNLVQLLWIGLACSYLSMVMERWGIPKWMCAAAVGTGIALPSSSMVLSFCWKDTAMTIFVIALIGQTIEVVCSGGEWLGKWYHALLYAAAAALASLMRHNGILLAAPLMLALVPLYWKRLRYRAFAAGVLVLVLMAGIKGPVYRLVGAQGHSQVAAEMLGLPMTILANVLVKEPEQLDSECREFLYRIGDQQLWENTYREGSWNSAKWMGEDISNDVIEEVGARNVLRYTWHAVCRSPYYAYRAVVRLFDVVWKPLGSQVTWSYHTNVHTGNVFGYEMKGFAPLQSVLDQIYDWSVNGGVLLTFGWHTGFFILLLLFAGVSRLGSDLSKCLYWIPVMCYNFGTALLLCGPDFRFFAFNTVVSFALFLAIVGEQNE